MSTIERALVLLERIAVGPSASQAELVRDLRIARSTMSDLLGELRALGYVAALGRRYVPGVKLLSLVARAGRDNAFAASVRTLLQNLVQAVGETAMLVVPLPSDSDHALQVMTLDEAQSPQELRYVAQIGAPYLATATTAGRAILAYGADGGGLPAATRALIRERGYALTENDSRGATLIAAPVILPGASTPIGAITVIGPSSRMQDVETRVWAAMRAAIETFTSAQAEDNEEAS